MKKTLTYILSAVSLIAVGCDSNIPEHGMQNMIPAEEIVLDDVIANGYEMRVGSTFSLPEHVSALPKEATDIAQAYRSDDETVAKVDAYGTITAIGVGNCNIFVAVGRAEELVASFGLTVVPIPDILVDRFEFVREETEITHDGVIPFNDVIKKFMNVTSEDPNETYTEKITFSSANEEVIKFDAAGNMTISPVVGGSAEITATTAKSGKTASTTVTIPRIEYERFPGDALGAQRAVMGSTEADANAPEHTDGGWTITELVYPDATDKSWVVGGGRNGYRYAMLDGRRLINRGASGGFDPTLANGSAFCFDRPKKNSVSNLDEDDEVYFIVDMRRENKVNYFRIIDISDNADDTGICLTKVSNLYGKNEGDAEWTLLASEITDFNPRYIIDSEGDPDNYKNYTYPIETSKAKFTTTKAYRYIKFSMSDRKCFGYFKTDGTSAKDGGTQQIAELYLGYDPALESAAE